MDNNYKVITIDLLFLNVEMYDVDKIINKIANKAYKLNYIDDIMKFTKSVLEREQELSTEIGYNIALPHGQSDAVKHPFIAFLRTKKFFKWSIHSKEQVQLIFLIGVPNNAEKIHLKFISQVSKKLLDKEFRHQLHTLKTKEQVYKILDILYL